VITGDGDGLSIGTNHLLHLMRRNVNVTVLLFNNRIYGLTKGQYSPTSEKGKKTKTTPQGSIDDPFNPVQLALAAGCSFVARGIDVDSQNLQCILKEAALHKGTSFVEIYQNCNVFNDGAFANISERALRAERTVLLQPGHPMIFGEKGDKALQFNGQSYEIVAVDESNKDQLSLHQNDISLPQAIALNTLEQPDFPVPIGIFRSVERPTYEEQIVSAKNKPSIEDVDQLLRSGKTWHID
jgi:2-oxoglutarate ferredoxin oxidoreductase subunit beta